MTRKPPDYAGQHVRSEPRRIKGIGCAILLASAGIVSIATVLVIGYGK